MRNRRKEIVLARAHARVIPRSSACSAERRATFLLETLLETTRLKANSLDLRPPDRSNRMFTYKSLFQLRHEHERSAKRPKKDIGKDDCVGIYNGNGLGIYHPVSQITTATDSYLHWAVFELAARGASAFRPWNATGNCKHRDK